MRRLSTLCGAVLLGAVFSSGVMADANTDSAPLPLILLAQTAVPHMTAQSAPTITLTSPPPNVVISEALTPFVLLQASVVAADAPIAHVVFYVCALKSGTCSVSDTTQFDVASPPYQVQWTPPRVVPQPSGAMPYQAWAMGIDTLGQAQNSMIVPFSLIQPPDPPSVTLVAPKVEGGYVTPTSPVLYATASPGNTLPPSTIARVDFLDGGTVIGSVATLNSVPTGYAFVWQNAPPGVHLVSARVTDSLGYSTTSNAVTIYIIGPDPPPVVTLTTPTTGQIFAPPNIVPLAATATSALGTIQRVEFVTADRVIGTALSPPYVGSWSNPPPGNFAIVAKAYDDVGVAATSPAAYIQVLPTVRTPVVVMTAPAPGATIVSGTPLPMAAMALAPDGNIGRVDFYADAALATLLGSSASAPYQFTWTNPASGTQSLTARAYDLQGIVGVSAPVRITVTNNLPPTVAITTPSSGAQYSSSSTIVLVATAADPDGTVAKVEFFAGATKVAMATNAPYSANWLNVSAGSYALTAVATDNLGATTTSAPVNVTITASPPSVTLATPQTGATVVLSQGIVITAQARAPQRSISRVEFYSDGNMISTAPISGGPSAIDVNFTWTSATAGAHALSAKLFTTDGANASSASVNITVSDLAVTLIEPFSGQVYQAPAQIRITANPTETNGAIAQVDFYGDGMLLGSAVGATYSFLWNAGGAGLHTVSAKARDVVGLTASSASISVTVVAAPTLQVDAGIDGSTVADDNASVSGRIQAPQNSAVTVNGVVAVLDNNGNYFVDGLQLQSGVNTVALSVATADGHTATKNITLNRTGAAPFEVRMDKQEGIVPFDATLSIVNRGGIAFQRIEIDTDGDGTPEVTLTSLPNNTQDEHILFQSAGTYSIAVKVFDAGNNVIYAAKRKVFGWDPKAFATRTIGVYTGMLDRLRLVDVDGALAAVTGSSNTRFRDIFAALGADVRTIADQLGAINHVTFNDQVMQIFVVRPAAGGPQTFMINLLRGEDGIWRIEDM